MDGGEKFAFAGLLLSVSGNQRLEGLEYEQHLRPWLMPPIDCEERRAELAGEQIGCSRRRPEAGAL